MKRLGLILLLVAPISIHLALRKLHRDPPPVVLGALPAFTLTDQDGKGFSAADLDGKLWVVDFFFSRCSGVCPLLAERMKDVLRFADAHPRFASRIGLLSITVDPEGDTPARLADYGARNRIDAARWRLLTGPSKAVEDVVVRGFHVAMGQPEGDPEKGRLDILHGTHLVLVDGRGRIRGYFDGDPSGVEKLTRTLGTMLDGADRGARTADTGPR